MFRKILGKLGTGDPDVNEPQRERREPTFEETPEADSAPVDAPQRSQADLANQGADILRKLMISHYTDEAGIHIETVLSAAAACAGYQAQRAGLWLIEADQPEGKAFAEVKEVPTASGDVFIVSELVNQLLAGDTDADRLTVLKVVAAGGIGAGGTRLPNMTEVARRTADARGSDDYPPLSVPPEHLPEENARAALQLWWPVVTKIFSVAELGRVDPISRMLALSLMTARLIEAGKDAVAPDTAMQLAMETAFAMAQVTGVRAELPA